MTEQKNVQRVQELYAAFGRGDAPAILDMLTDDVVRYDPGAPQLPHAGRYIGREGVGRFFGSLGETLEIDQFAPTESLAQTDRVVVLGALHARVRETGRSNENEWAMVWTLRDDKVAGLQTFEDTAREPAAHVA
jgi:ketosteroid isomerase-like protein